MKNAKSIARAKTSFQGVAMPKASRTQGGMGGSARAMLLEISGDAPAELVPGWAPIINPSDIQAVIDHFPLLNDCGLTDHRQRDRTPDEAQKRFERARADLLASADACTRCCAWIIANLQPAKPSTISSYHLKHVAELDIGYVTNGVFIVAAVHAGFTIKPTGINALIGVSRKSLHAVYTRQNASGKGRWAI